MRSAMSLKLAFMLAMCTLAFANSKNADYGIPWMYQGLAVWAFAWAALDAFAIGANDVANSFATSVGSRTITYGQACIIACIAEFVGCIALGKDVTDTIRGKIVNVNYFKDDPYVLMLGMSCVGCGSAIWVTAATALNLPVSTTHATVGAVMGVGIAAFGPMGVNWNYDSGGFGSIVASWFISPAVAACLGASIYLSLKFIVLRQPDQISFNRGVAILPFYAFITFGIIAGFMIFKGIPIASTFSEDYTASIPTVFGVGIGFGVVTALTVVPWVRRFIMDNENLPWWTVFFILCIPVGKYGYYEEGTHDNDKTAAQAAHGAANKAPSDPDDTPALTMMSRNAGGPAPMAPYSPQPPSSYMGGAPNMPYGQPYGLPYGQPRPFGAPQPYPVSMQQTPMAPPVQGYNFGQSYTVAGARFGGKDSEDGLKAVQLLEEDRPRTSAGIPMFYTTNDKWYDTILRRIVPGVYVDVQALCDEIGDLHEHANHYYDKTERLYKVLQISSCTFSSVAHGANDIANSIGPLSAVWAIYTTGTLNSKSPVQTWILAYGGAFLDLGLVLYGHNIMMVLGNKLTYHTPSRGFSMELGSMFTVLIFSKLGVPISSTHCITGATTGVGLCNGDVKAVNWRMIAIILGGWIITCPSAGVITGLLFWGLGTTPHPRDGNGFWSDVRLHNFTAPYIPPKPYNASAVKK